MTDDWGWDASGKYLVILILMSTFVVLAIRFRRLRLAPSVARYCRFATVGGLCGFFLTGLTLMLSLGVVERRGQLFTMLDRGGSLLKWTLVCSPFAGSFIGAICGLILAYVGRNRQAH
jgi:hypothetical protein